MCLQYAQVSRARLMLVWIQELLENIYGYQLLKLWFSSSATTRLLELLHKVAGCRAEKRIWRKRETTRRERRRRRRRSWGQPATEKKEEDCFLAARRPIFLRAFPPLSYPLTLLLFISFPHLVVLFSRRWGAGLHKRSREKEYRKRARKRALETSTGFSAVAQKAHSPSPPPHTGAEEPRRTKDVALSNLSVSCYDLNVRTNTRVFAYRSRSCELAPQKRTMLLFLSSRAGFARARPRAASLSAPSDARSCTTKGLFPAGTVTARALQRDP